MHMRKKRNKIFAISKNLSFAIFFNLRFDSLSSFKYWRFLSHIQYTEGNRTAHILTFFLHGFLMTELKNELYFHPNITKGKYNNPEIQFYLWSFSSSVSTSLVAVAFWSDFCCTAPLEPNTTAEVLVALALSASSSSLLLFSPPRPYVHSTVITREIIR